MTDYDQLSLNVATRHFGELRAPNPIGALGTTSVWKCQHGHVEVTAAIRCAERELESRRLQRRRVRFGGDGMNNELLIERGKDGVRVSVIDPIDRDQDEDFVSAEFTLPAGTLDQFVEALREVYNSK
jgi:hypothetical protein